MSLISLTNRSPLRLTGGERHSFLDGLLTNSTADLQAGDSRYAALLTPQGKVIEAMLLFETGDALYLDVAESVRDALVRRLTMYKLRAQVEIEDLSASHLVAADLTGTTPETSLAGGTDPRDDALGWRGVLPKADLPNAPDTDAANAYHAKRMSLGIADSDELAREKDFWLETGAERANGVSFTKGCYVGQELTARMKHRSSPKKMILPVAIAGELAAGADWALKTAEGKPAGSLRAVTPKQDEKGETIGLAYIRLEHQDADLLCGDLSVSVKARYA